VVLRFVDIEGRNYLPSVFQCVCLLGIEIDDRKDKMTIVALELEKWIVNMVKFARRLPGFSELSQADQTTLLKGTIVCLYDKVIIRKDRIK
jgi:hypothetical protein